jgi:hypothetical protein
LLLLLHLWLPAVLLCSLPPDRLLLAVGMACAPPLLTPTYWHTLWLLPLHAPLCWLLLLLLLLLLLGLQ